MIWLFCKKWRRDNCQFVETNQFKIQVHKIMFPCTVQKCTGRTCSVRRTNSVTRPETKLRNSVKKRVESEKILQPCDLWEGHFGFLVIDRREYIFISLSPSLSLSLFLSFSLSFSFSLFLFLCLSLSYVCV